MKKFWLFLLFFISIAVSQAAQSPPGKQTITTGSIKFPTGTTITPSFDVPTDTTGILTAQIDCNETISLTVKVDESIDGGKTWTCDGGAPCRGFSRVPGPCTDIQKNPLAKIAAVWTVSDSDNNSIPFPGGLKMRGIIQTNQAFTATVDFIFDVTK